MADDTGFELQDNVKQPTSIQDLRPKMQLTGRVTNIDLYGAFVDIGIGKDALVHISKLKKGAVNRVDEILSLDDQVTVYVDKVDTHSQRVSLTMIKPLDVTWNELKKGQVFTGRITRLEPYGMFVDIGAERAGLVHVSEMGGELIGRPSDVFSTDDEVNVRVIDFDRRKRRIDLALVTETVREEGNEEESEEDEEVQTAMELALRQALEGTESHLLNGRKKRPQMTSPQKRKDQDDLLNRTLRNRKS